MGKYVRYPGCCTVAIVALPGCDEVSGWLTCGLHAVMTTAAGTSHAGVVKVDI